jgi:hypothetical protein
VLLVRDINQEANDAEVCVIESGSVIGIPPYALKSTGAGSTIPYALKSTGIDRYHFGSNEHTNKEVMAKYGPELLKRLDATRMIQISIQEDEGRAHV